MPRIQRLPSDTSPNGWHSILQPREPKPALAGELRTRWAIIGAGFTGLAAARRLAENNPRDHVVLVEAQEAGIGTSGRNTGIAIDVPYNSGAPLTELEGRRRHIRLNRAAIEQLDALVTTHRIDCQWSKRGKYHAAISEQGKTTGVDPVAQELDALGEPYEWLTRDELEQEVGTRFYCAGIFTPGAVLLNPAALVRGLADNLPTNVRLYERTPVVDIDYGNSIRLRTPKGAIVADNLIIAANGFANEFGFYRGHLLNFAIYASLTRRLTDEERARVPGEGDWGLTPANVFGGAAMRFTQDNRFVIRQAVIHSPSSRQSEAKLKQVAANHRQLFHARFPRLANVDLDYTWVGFDSMSDNRGHGFARMAPNVFTAVCQNGVGVTKGTIAGILIADRATGRDNPLIADIEAIGEPNRVPPRPFLDLGIAARFAWDKFRNSGEWK